MSVVSTHSEPLGRKLREGVEMVAGKQDILLNSKEEFLHRGNEVSEIVLYLAFDTRTNF